MTQPLPTPDPLVGRLLDGRYRLGAKLGEGGMGAVYRATHTLMDRPCAIKVLRGPGAIIKLAGKRFQREAHSASRLDHDNCIRVTDFGVTGENVMYLVMELLEGRSLAEELAVVGALSQSRVVHVARQVAGALVHAHGLGIVHRDLKPDNIFLVARGEDPDFVKVLDFGLAKILDDRSDRATSTLSEAGTVFGTPEYMAPEQAEGKPLDARADLYSFGVVLYHMMTGQLPFQGASLVAILTQHLTQDPVSPAVRRPDLNLPPELVSLCLRCLEKLPDRRPATADQVLAVLDSLEDVAPTPAPPRVPALVASLPTVDFGEPPVLSVADVELEPPRSRAGLYAFIAAPLVLAGGIVLLILVKPAPTAVVSRVDASVAPRPVPDPPPTPTPTPSLTPSLDEPRSARPTAASHLREAAAYADKGNHIKELFHLQQAVRLEPANAEALFRFGSALLNQGRADLGCEKLARAAQLGSKQAETLQESAGCPPRAAH